jgi:hypothetical protein
MTKTHSLHTLSGSLKCALIAGLAVAALPTAKLHASEHGAHTHGVSQLDIALSGNDLEVGLTVPGTDIVGFEHAARSAEDKAAVAAAVTRLKKAETLFSLPDAARCRLAKSEVRAAGIAGDHDGNHAHETAEKTGTKAENHEHEHAHDGDRHENESHHEHRKEAGGDHHAEFKGHYRFHCDNPERVDGVEVKIFKVFPSITRINARIITPRGQSAKAVTAGSPRLDF